MATSDLNRPVGRSFDTPKVSDPATQKGLDEAARAAREMSAMPFMKGVHHIVNSIGAGASVTVSHKLGRKPRGWWCADVIGGPFVVYRVSSDEKSITFTNPGAVAIGFAFWVY